MTRHAPGPARRNQILRAARTVFLARGYGEARVEDVARTAGLSKGAVYHHFPSKRDLFLALVREEHEATYSFLDDADGDDRAAVVKIIALGQRYVDYFAGLKTPPRFFLMMCEQAIRDDEVREECQAVHQRFVDAAARLLAQGMSEGAFRPADPVAVALMLKALIDGLAGQSAIGIRPDAVALQGDGLGLLLHGLLQRPSG